MCFPKVFVFSMSAQGICYVCEREWKVERLILLIIMDSYSRISHEIISFNGQQLWGPKSIQNKNQATTTRNPIEKCTKKKNCKMKHEIRSQWRLYLFLTIIKMSFFSLFFCCCFCYSQSKTFMWSLGLWWKTHTYKEHITEEKSLAHQSTSTI